MKKVEEVKRPLKKGGIYLVPCIVEEIEQLGDWIMIKGEPTLTKSFAKNITPVFNHPHSDIEQIKGVFINQ